MGEFQKKRILFLMSSLQGGGAEKVLISMLKNFDYQHFDVSLALVSPVGIYMSAIPSEVRVLSVFKSSNSLAARIGFYLYSKFRLSFWERVCTRRAIREHYDTIISFCEGRSLKFHGYLMDRAQRNVAWVHCDLFTMHYTIGPVLSANDEKRLYEAMDEVVFVSNESREQFLKLGYRVRHTTVIYNPIDVAEIQKYRVGFPVKGL